MESSKPTVELFEDKTATFTSYPFEATGERLTFQVVGTLGTGDSVAIQACAMETAPDQSSSAWETIYTFDDSSTDKIENIDLGEGVFYRAVFTSANSNSTSCYAK